MGSTQSDIALKLSELKKNNTALLGWGVAILLDSIHGGEHRPHHVEEDSFEVSKDGVPFAGGSYYVKGNKLILASVTPQVELGLVGQFDDIKRNLRNLK